MFTCAIFFMPHTFPIWPLHSPLLKFLEYQHLRLRPVRPSMPSVPQSPQLRIAQYHTKSRETWGVLFVFLVFMLACHDYTEVFIIIVAVCRFTVNMNVFIHSFISPIHNFKHYLQLISVYIKSSHQHCMTRTRATFNNSDTRIERLRIRKKNNTNLSLYTHQFKRYWWQLHLIKVKKEIISSQSNWKSRQINWKRVSFFENISWKTCMASPISQPVDFNDQVPCWAFQLMITNSYTFFSFFN